MPGLTLCAAALAILLSFLPAPGISGENPFQPWRGEPKPGFALDALLGGQENLEAYRSRPVIVHFFATWCEPCRKEITSLRELAARLPKDEVAVIGVDVGEVDIRVRRFFENLPVNFPILLDRESNTAKAWQVDALPMTFLLDRKLMPKYFVAGDFDWNRPEVVRLLTEIAIEQPEPPPPRGGT